MCSFDSPALPDCLALASAEELLIGTIDDIQKLHVQSIPLHEWPRRIAHDTHSHTLAVCTIKYTMENVHSDVQQPQQQHLNINANSNTSNTMMMMEEVEVSYVRLLDDQSFDTLHTYQLDPFETACSIVCLSFDTMNSTTTTATATATSGSSSHSTATATTSSALTGQQHHVRNETNRACQCFMVENVASTTATLKIARMLYDSPYVIDIINVVFFSTSFTRSFIDE
jgi:hypothetical protein